jgi:cobyrinic acid a,c-diamide synthase
MKGAVIAGAGSGVGKTSIATGTMLALSRRMKVQPFKVGPDFIDPLYHTAATGRRSRNLDTFMVPGKGIRGIVGSASKGADVCIVEGVRGLYEGLSGTSDSCSTAEAAKILGLPVILVLDARSLTRSAAAIVNGFAAFDPGVDIRGVILNNVSGKQHEDKLRDAIGRYCDVEIVGMVRRHEGCELKSRHLGLKTVDGREGEVSALEALADDLDMDAFMGICESCEAEFPEGSPYAEHSCGARVAVPMDEAYCFYYEENLECLRAAGIEVVTFSPLAGDPLPDVDMYYLGGGYPELFASRISENRDFLEGLANASAEGKPVMGECGGLMTMCEAIVDSEGNRHPMAGILAADAVMCGRHGPKYTISEGTPENPLFSGMVVRGHEFHYSELRLRKEGRFGFRMDRGQGILDGMDGLVSGNSIGSYSHMNALSVQDWAGGIVERLRRFANMQKLLFYWIFMIDLQKFPVFNLLMHASHCSGPGADEKRSFQESCPWPEILNHGTMRLSVPENLFYPRIEVA